VELLPRQLVYLTYVHGATAGGAFARPGTALQPGGLTREILGETGVCCDTLGVRFEKIALDCKGQVVVEKSEKDATAYKIRAELPKDGEQIG